MSYDVRRHRFGNNSWGRLTSSITGGSTTLVVALGAGASWPSIGVGEIFKATIFDPFTGSREIVNCTGFSGASLLVERGKEGTSAQSFSAGVIVQHSITAETLEWFESQV